MKLKWFEEFFNLYFNGKVEKAYKHKHENIPKKLYKFQPFHENRLDTVFNNKLWFTLPKDMNDPFDSKGMCWNSEEIEVFFKEKIIKDNIDKFESIDTIVKGLISSLRDNMKITCFSEEVFSMPMWSHYADNHKGFCIEYNFSSLNWDNNMTKNLFPVGYETYRYDITNLFKLTLGDVYDPRVKLLYFLMNIKHNSWSYEKEWRIMNIRESYKEDFGNGLEDCKLKPTAIYLGLNFNKDSIIDIKSKVKDTNIPIYALKVNNSQFFDMRLEQV